jgi:hypothetical protein
MAENAVLYEAIYDNVELALEDLDAFEQLHDEKVVGNYDAAVIDKEDGKPHIVKRVDRPSVRVIPEWFGRGELPRNELHEAAEQLGEGEAGLVVVGEPTLQEGFERAVTRAAKTAKRDFDKSTDELADDLIQASKE